MLLRILRGRDIVLSSRSWRRSEDGGVVVICFQRFGCVVYTRGRGSAPPDEMCETIERKRIGMKTVWATDGTDRLADLSGRPFDELWQVALERDADLGIRWTEESEVCIRSFPFPRLEITIDNGQVPPTSEARVAWQGDEDKVQEHRAQLVRLAEMVPESCADVVFSDEPFFVRGAGWATYLHLKGLSQWRLAPRSGPRVAAALDLAAALSTVWPADEPVEITTDSERARFIDEYDRRVFNALGGAVQRAFGASGLDFARWIDY